ncbi:hypothetical protein Y032_0096g2920 [Ancylostoma ceylanicum]|uniref:Uncharacterized protein n=1 Tax=Ancylostoma ceylanicum TaxID=53326 RepID=A0A016TK47_9BILA|nr:hypothetical protein Y032_0096g2920 [Ancylostoma ceylanicum]
MSVDEVHESEDLRTHYVWSFSNFGFFDYHQSSIEKHSHARRSGNLQCASMVVVFPRPRKTCTATAPLTMESSTANFVVPERIPDRAARPGRMLFEAAERPPLSPPTVL